MTKLALYFGGGSGGHFLRGLSRDTLDPQRDCPGFPWTARSLDTGLLNNRGTVDRPDGRVFWTCGYDGFDPNTLWFAFFWWDRSEDGRPGSNSGFYVRGFSFEEREAAFHFACEKWPLVVGRQSCPLVLQS
jgi:hypothetical protein